MARQLRRLYRRRHLLVARVSGVYVNDFGSYDLEQSL